MTNELKPLSVTTNVVGLQTDNAGHVGQNSSAHVARVLGLQTDAVVVTETHLNYNTARKKRPRYAITYQIVLISLKAFIALKLNIVLS